MNFAHVLGNIDIFVVGVLLDADPEKLKNHCFFNQLFKIQCAEYAIKTNVFERFQKARLFTPYKTTYPKSMPFATPEAEITL